MRVRNIIIIVLLISNFGCMGLSHSRRLNKKNEISVTLQGTGPYLPLIPSVDVRYGISDRVDIGANVSLMPILGTNSGFVETYGVLNLYKFKNIDLNSHVSTNIYYIKEDLYNSNGFQVKNELALTAVLNIKKGYIYHTSSILHLPKEKNSEFFTTYCLGGGYNFSRKISFEIELDLYNTIDNDFDKNSFLVDMGINYKF